MKNPKQLLILIVLFACTALIKTGCSSTEELIEEPEPEVVEVAEDDPEDWDFEPEPEPEPEPEAIEVPELQTINFAFDRSNIDDNAARSLAENLERFLELPEDYRVNIDAYTDHVGGDQYNLRLSQRRANSVVRFYTDNGVNADRIDSNGLGKAPVPCASQDADGPGCLQNRRAESFVVEPFRAPGQDAPVQDAAEQE